MFLSSYQANLLEEFFQNFGTSSESRGRHFITSLLTKQPSFQANMPSINLVSKQIYHGIKVSARRVSSRPVDTHFWKKYKKNTLNLL